MQESEKSDILERQVICCEKSAVTFITGSILESVTVPVSGVGVVVVAAVVEVGVSKKEHVTSNYVFVHV